MIVLRVPPGQLPGMLGRLNARMLAGARAGLLGAAHRGRALMVTRTRTAPPASENGEPGAFNTGHYARSWKVTPAGPDTVVLSNDTRYAAVIEHGRRAGRRRPPREALVRWLQRRAGLDEREARRAAFVVARAIGKRGLRARRVMTGARADLQRYLVEEVRRGIDRALAGAAR